MYFFFGMREEEDPIYESVLEAMNEVSEKEKFKEE